jgi:hypothetical protein
MCYRQNKTKLLSSSRDKRVNSDTATQGKAKSYRRKDLRLSRQSGLMQEYCWYQTTHKFQCIREGPVMHERISATKQKGLGHTCTEKLKQVSSKKAWPEIAILVAHVAHLTKARSMIGRAPSNPTAAKPSTDKELPNLLKDRTKRDVGQASAARARGWIQKEVQTPKTKETRTSKPRAKREQWPAGRESKQSDHRPGENESQQAQARRTEETRPEPSQRCESRQRRQLRRRYESED